MDRKVATYNWCPDTYQEFLLKAHHGLVDLNIMNRQYLWLYREIIPRNQSLFRRVFMPKSFVQRLKEEMMESEEIFLKVHRKGIDLVLLENVES